MAVVIHTQIGSFIGMLHQIKEYPINTEITLLEAIKVEFIRVPIPSKLGSMMVSVIAAADYAIQNELRLYLRDYALAELTENDILHQAYVDVLTRDKERIAKAQESKKPGKIIQ